MEKDMTILDLPKRRLRTKDAAAYIGLSKSTLEKYRVTATGPVYAALGRIVVYDVDDLDAWVEARKRHSTSEPAPEAA
jgi:predicted DNA-binding transcriptional regulator AlpA